MPQSLKKFVGVVLLVLSVGVTSCQAMVSDGRPLAEDWAPAPPAVESPSG